MKVILKKDLDKVGNTGEIVTVKDGFARNYLIPQGFAVFATPGNLKIYEQERKRLQAAAEKAKEEAQAFAEELEKVSITAAVQVGEEDKVFGAVTNQTIADLLAEKGYQVDRKKIQLEEPIKELGRFEVPVKVHSEVQANVKVWVVRE